jgi:hypothetical protein
MAPYFGAHQADPQGVVIKDDSTGFLGFGRNTVTATSILSDTVWGLALPEIWCNSGGNPLYAFMASALMVAYRDESGYADSLGILSAGPLGGFTASMVVTNADGYRYVVAPMVDGYLWQGLKLDGNLNVTKYQPGMGLRYVTGSDRRFRAPTTFRSARDLRRSGSRTYTRRALRRARFASSSPLRFSRARPTNTR